jgi:hypothetical protein
LDGQKIWYFFSYALKVTFCLPYTDSDKNSKDPMPTPCLKCMVAQRTKHKDPHYAASQIQVAIDFAILCLLVRDKPIVSSLRSFFAQAVTQLLRLLDVRKLKVSVIYLQKSTSFSTF